MSAKLARPYGATPFGPDDRENQIHEAARQVIVSNARAATDLIQDHADMAIFLGGLLLGIAQVAQAKAATFGDMTAEDIDNAIVVSIAMVTPSAVGLARSSEVAAPIQ